MKLLTLFESVKAPLPLRVTLPCKTNSVKEPVELRLRLPLLVMLPKAFRTSPFRIVSESAEPLNASVPKFPPLTFMFTLAVAVPMVTALLLVGTPALQFPAGIQVLSPGVPVHESAERRRGGRARTRGAPARAYHGPDLTECTVRVWRP